MSCFDFFFITEKNKKNRSYKERFYIDFNLFKGIHLPNDKASLVKLLHL